MKSVILCEGRTDFLFLQYFMKNVYHWKDDSHYPEYKDFFIGNRILRKDDSELVIGFCGGCSKIPYALNKILSINKYSGLDDTKYDHIIVITDRDDESSESDMIKSMTDQLLPYTTPISYELQPNIWNNIEYLDTLSQKSSFQLLLLVIPPVEFGALETFILNSISNTDLYEKAIIETGNQFIDTVDPQNKYLQRHRDFEKAKFNTYLSVRIPEIDYVKLHNIFKDINWNNYPYMIESLTKLSEI